MDNLFGTDGIRARVGLSPLTTQHLPQLCQAIATWVAQNTQTKMVAIGGDTRTSTPWIVSSLTTALVAQGVNVQHCGVLPTPALCALIKEDPQLSYGLMITASHNPFQDNGIKIFTPHGKLDEESEKAISQLFYHPPTPAIPTLFGSVHTRPGGEWYETFLRKQCAPDFLKNKSIVLDCAHGATSLIAPHLFWSLGATVQTINANPNGTNINDACGAVHPQQLVALVKKLNADAGFAFDGDGDRIIMVTKSGKILDGDDLIALLLQHPHYRNQPVVVGTLMSNMGLESLVKRNNKQFIRTPVGDKYITQALKEHGGLLGGEPSGHIIMRDYLPIGDGIYTALRCLEVLNRELEPTTFTHYPQVAINLPIKKKKELSELTVAHQIETLKHQLQDGRVIIRYSGTEPVIRIMVEDTQEEKARHVGQTIARLLEQELC